MNKNLIQIIFLVSFILYSCKGGKTKTDESVQTTTVDGSESKPLANKDSEIKANTVTATPDSATLGKNKEAFIRIKNLKEVRLTNPEGENTGTELSYDIEVTNNNKIGGNNIFINPNDFRLLLDNGIKITHDNYNSVSADPESTKSSIDNKFKLPPGTKPASLNLFFNETSASVKFEVK